MRFCENAGLKWLTEQPATTFDPCQGDEVCFLVTTIPRGIHRLAWDYEPFITGFGLKVLSCEEFFAALQVEVDAETTELLREGCA